MGGHDLRNRRCLVCYELRLRLVEFGLLFRILRRPMQTTGAPLLLPWQPTTFSLSLLYTRFIFHILELNLFQVILLEIPKFGSLFLIIICLFVQNSLFQQSVPDVNTSIKRASKALTDFLFFEFTAGRRYFIRPSAFLFVTCWPTLY